MKKMNKIVFTIVLCIISCGIGVTAATVYQANTVMYTPTDTNWKVTNVSEALNSLNEKVNVGTATASQILSGKTALVKGQSVTGTMTNRGAVTTSLNAGGSYTIPAGYHNGSGKITANSLSSQTSATATAEDIASGKTAYVNGTKITGTYSGGTTIIDLGTGTSFDVSSYAGYENFTADNFIVEVPASSSLSTQPSAMAASYATNVRPNGSASFKITKTYDSSTGKFTLTAKFSLTAKLIYGQLIDNANTANATSSKTSNISCNVYLVIPA